MNRFRTVVSLNIACLALLTTAAPAQRVDTKLLKEANEALRQNQPAKAMELIRRADRSGRDATAKKLLSVAHQMRGKERFGQSKLDLAYRDYFAANRLSPNKESILQSLGVITYELKRSREAKEYMERVLRLNPKNAQALGILGRIAKKNDNVGAASKYFNKAAQNDPGRSDFKRMAKKLGKEAKVEEKFVTLSKGNFRVQFERGKHVGVEKAVHTVHQYLETAYRDLRKELGAAPGRRITVVVYNKTQFRRVSSAHSWARAYFDGKVRVAIKAWPAGRVQLRKDLRHELTHAFLRMLHPKTPTWLHEGLAQLVEGASWTSTATSFRNGRYKQLPIKTLMTNFTNTKDAEAARVGYAQALVLVGYLKRKGGARRIQTLLREVGRGNDAKHAVRAVYGKSVEELMKEALK